MPRVKAAPSRAGLPSLRAAIATPLSRPAPALVASSSGRA
jgi:hypothetical protein